MPRQRIPTEKAKLTGAMAVNPGRFKDRANPPSAGPVGAPPSWMDKREKDAWKELVKLWSWLNADDRPGLTALSQMYADLKDPEVKKGAAFYTAYRLLLGEFGGTPVTRSKVYMPPPDKEDNPFAEFVN